MNILGFKSSRPCLVVERELERCYSPVKIELAKRKAYELLEEFPQDPLLFRNYIKKHLDYTVSKSVSFGLNVNGQAKMLSLIVIPLSSKIIYKLRALENPLFSSPDF